MQGRMTRRHAVLAGAAAGVLAARQSKATTTWQAYTYNPVGTVASVVGFKRLIDASKKPPTATTRSVCIAVAACQSQGKENPLRPAASTSPG